ncbi:hypothetical protein [Legionella sp.]|uniref:hypothetical protein n=1 Tax=Legionella sp. TaxID=459 RepID=UPI0032203C7A
MTIHTLPITASNSDSSFFTVAPPEILMNIYSNLPSRDLFQNCKLINQKSRVLAEQILFSRRDKESIAYQAHLLKGWASDTKKFINCRNEEDLKTFYAILSASIEAPSLTFSHRLHGAVLMGVINDATLKIEEAEMAQFKLHYWNSTGMEYLTELVGLITENQLTEIISLLEESLRNNLAFYDVIKCLTLLTPRLTEEQVIEFFLRIIENINQSVASKSNKFVIAKQCITTFATRLSDTRLANIITQMDGMPEGEQPVKLECLAIFASRFKPIQLADFTQMVIKDLNVQNPAVCEAALQCLSVFASRLERVQLEFLAPMIIKKLNHPNEGVVMAALQCLTMAFSSTLKDTELEVVTNSIIEKLKRDQSSYISMTLHFLKAFSSRLKLEVMEEFAILMVENSSDTTVFTWGWEYTEECLKILSLYLSEKKSQELLTILASNLEENDYDIIECTLKYYAALAPGFNERQLEELLRMVDEMLDDENYGLYTGGLDCLTAFIPRLSEAQIGKIANIISFKMFNHATFDNFYEDSVVHLRAEQQCIAALIKRLNDNQLSELAAEFISTLQQPENPERPTYETALCCLAMFAARLEETQLLETTTAVITQLDHESEQVRLVALKSLKSLLPQLNTKQLQEVTPIIALRCHDEHPEVRVMVLKRILLLVPKLDGKQMEEFGAIIIQKLNDENGNVRIMALECLQLFIPKLNEKQLGEVIAIIEQKLNDSENENERSEALELASYLLILGNKIEVKANADSSLLTPETLVVRILRQLLDTIKIPEKVPEIATMGEQNENGSRKRSYDCQFEENPNAKRVHL